MATAKDVILENHPATARKANCRRGKESYPERAHRADVKEFQVTQAERKIAPSLEAYTGAILHGSSLTTNSRSSCSRRLLRDIRGVELLETHTAVEFAYYGTLSRRDATASGEALGMRRLFRPDMAVADLRERPA